MILVRCLKNEKGYALIEVVFLVTVIAIISSIIIPKISNEFKIAQADYLMKSLYSEIRFMQTAKRTSIYKKSDVLLVTKPSKSFVIISNNSLKQFRLRMGDDEEIRKYNLPSYFSFENDFFISVKAEGTISDSLGNNSDHIKLIDNGTNKVYKPFIVFDSVGRIRFSNDGS